MTDTLRHEFDVTVRVSLPAEVAKGGWEPGEILAAAARACSPGPAYRHEEFVQSSIKFVRERGERGVS